MKSWWPVSRVVLLFALLMSTGLLASPQSSAPPQQLQAGGGNGRTEQPPALEQPADFKAYNEVLKNTERAKLVDGLVKFVAEYPDSYLVSSAESLIRSESLAIAGEFTKKYQQTVAKSYGAGKSPIEQAQAYLSMARELSTAGVLLDQAEEFAVKALQYNDVEKFIVDYRAAKKSSSPPKLPPNTVARFQINNGRPTNVTLVPQTQAPPPPSAPPTDEALRAQFQSTQSQVRTVLGQIYLKRGKTDEAEKTLKAVYTDSAASSSSRLQAARSLAEVARKKGDNGELVDYLVELTVLGAQPEWRRELDDVYKKAHNGSLAGLNEMIDARFHASTKPVHVTPYLRPKSSNARLVLAELFTGAACPPCVSVDMAFDGVLERYSRQDVAVVVYHVHVPGPDPMTNLATQARAARDGIYAVGGVPTFAIDGLTNSGGGSAEAAPAMFDTVSKAIEKQLAQVPEAALALKAKVVGSTIKVSADVSKITSKSDKLKLQIALVEQQQRYSGPNGVRFHPMVVRSLAGEGFKGFAVPQKGTHVEHVFDIAKIMADNRKTIDEFLTKPFRGGANPEFNEGRRDEIDPGRLMVVAFVQDEDSTQKTPEGSSSRQLMRKVLQAASVKVPASVKTN